MANSKASQATDTLNSIGTFILDIDYRLIGLQYYLLLLLPFSYRETRDRPQIIFR